MVAGEVFFSLLLASAGFFCLKTGWRFRRAGFFLRRTSEV
jgi:hypothetical protein